MILVGFGVFGVVFCGGYFLMLSWNRYQVQLDARLGEIPRTSDHRPGSASWTTQSPPGQTAGIQWRSILGRLSYNSEGASRYNQARLVQAGLYDPRTLSTYLAARMAFAICPPLFGLVAGWLGLADPARGLLFGCLVGAVGMILPSFWLDQRIRRRQVLLRRAIPDFLDLMIVCLKSGLSMQGAIQRVSAELATSHRLLAGELSIVQRDIDLGAAIDVALRRFADRSGCESVRSLSAYVREAQRFGGEISEALRTHADMLRIQRENTAEEAAQKASVKILIPMLLLILPAVFVVLAGPAAIQIQQAFSKQQ